MCRPEMQAGIFSSPKARGGWAMRARRRSGRQALDLLSPNFATAAAGLGCQGIRVERPDELAAALDAAFAATKPVVVDVRTDKNSTPIHSYARRLSQGRYFPRPGTVYELVEWRQSPPEPTTGS